MHFSLLSPQAVQALLLLGSLAGTCHGAVQNQVKTTSGVVRGHPAAQAPAVSEYLGIPYAKPATGNLRFAAPEAYRGNGTLPGDKFSSDCPILFNPVPPEVGAINPVLAGYASAIDQTNHTFAEDCLSVNVWTNPDVGDKAKAVMVWIHGGAFTTGASSCAAYNGAELAQKGDVVVVTMNYRLDFFGFASGPGMTDLNFGLRDQRLAVEWVRDNIAAFGGDPKRITLFGQSAGGASVDIYSYAWTQDPIVNAFIEESGTAGLEIQLGPSPPANASSSANATSSANEKWFKVTKAVGCGGAEAGAAALTCMRGKPLQQILNATASQLVTSGPTPDGKVVFSASEYAARADSGAFIQRPIITGSNENEAGLFSASSGGQIPAPALLALNAQFACGAASAAAAREKNNVKSWRYRYSGLWPNLDIGMGTVHSAEVSLVFGNTENVTKSTNTPAENEVSKLFIKAWTDFARDPETGLTELGSVGWPPYQVAGSTLVQIALNNSVTPIFTNSTGFDSICLGGPPS